MGGTSRSRTSRSLEVEASEPIASWLGPVIRIAELQIRFRQIFRSRVQESRPVFRLILGMSRKLRFVPEGGALVEVTCRTIQGRPLLRPSQQLNDIFLGVL